MLMEHIMACQGQSDTTKTDTLWIHVMMVWPKEKKMDLTDLKFRKKPVPAFLYMPLNSIFKTTLEKQTVVHVAMPVGVRTFTLKKTYCRHSTISSWVSDGCGILTFILTHWSPPGATQLLLLCSQGGTRLSCAALMYEARQLPEARRQIQSHCELKASMPQVSRNSSILLITISLKKMQKIKGTGNFRKFKVEGFKWQGLSKLASYEFDFKKQTRHPDGCDHVI